MVFLKLNYNKLTKIWLYFIFKLSLKKGNSIKSFNYLVSFIKILRKCNIPGIQHKLSLNSFFFIIYKNLYSPVSLMKRVVRGQVVLVPAKIKLHREIRNYLTLIFINSKDKIDNGLILKLIAELIDVFLNKGNSIKKQLEYRKKIISLVPNRKLLK